MYRRRVRSSTREGSEQVLEKGLGKYWRKVESEKVPEKGRVQASTKERVRVSTRERVRVSTEEGSRRVSEKGPGEYRRKV